MLFQANYQLAKHRMVIYSTLTIYASPALQKNHAFAVNQVTKCKFPPLPLTVCTIGEKEFKMKDEDKFIMHGLHYR